MYARAWALCAQSGDTPRRFPTLWGLCLCYRSQGALRKTRDIGEQLVRLATTQGFPLFVECGTSWGAGCWPGKVRVRQGWRRCARAWRP